MTEETSCTCENEVIELLLQGKSNKQIANLWSGLDFTCFQREFPIPMLCCPAV
jgi:hypothetical protein